MNNDFQRPEARLKIPKGLQPVFKGVIFDVYQWQQEMFDGSMATFESLKRADTVTVIAVTPEKQICILEQEQPEVAPFIGCAGGRVEPGEDVLNAAKRELLEETGLSSDTWSVINSSQVTSKIDWVIFLLIARNCKQLQASTLDSGEKISVKFVSFDDFLNLALSDNFRDKDITNLVLKAKLHPERMQLLKQQLFG